MAFAACRLLLPLLLLLLLPGVAATAAAVAETVHYSYIAIHIGPWVAPLGCVVFDGVGPLQCVEICMDVLTHVFDVLPGLL